MPNINPISDLKNHTDILKDVNSPGRIYIARNDHPCQNRVDIAKSLFGSISDSMTLEVAMEEHRNSI